MDSIVDALAESSAHSDYLLDPERHEGPSLEEIHRARRMSGVDDTPIPDDWSPKAIYDYICQRIRGQDEAKRAAAMVVYNHVDPDRPDAEGTDPGGFGGTAGHYPNPFEKY